MYTYRGTLTRWVDGDTAIIEIDLGFYTKRTERIRLARINTPETRDHRLTKRREAVHAKMVAKKICPHGSTVTVRTFKSKRDMYARYIAEVTFQGVNISDYLLEQGVAKAISL